MSAMGIIIYSFALWMGLYLLERNGSKPGMAFAGLGLVTYAFGLALVLLLPESRPWHFAAAILPLICWFGAVYRLLPGESRAGLPKRPLIVIALGTVFFFMGLAGLIIPQAWFGTDMTLLAIGMDLLLVGYGIAALDAHDEGEALLPDALRSLGAAVFGVVIFGGQVVIVMAIEQNTTLGMQVLLVGIISTVIALQVFAPRVQTGLDQVIFRESPALHQSRAELTAVAEALPRVNPELEILQLDYDEFARLTRRALGHMGNLDRLVTSPLMQLPQIDQRLYAADKPDHSLERAAMLKAILTESILKLKPNGSDSFGTSDEWRYFNALYYPYVAGLKPFSRRNPHDELDTDSRAALDWFQSQVPERTLYNWQNAAARLIAQDLREQIHAEIRVLAG